VLLTPAAAAVSRQLMDDTADPRWDGFRPDRFSRVPDTSGDSHNKEAA
jgi:glycine oxidase